MAEELGFFSVCQRPARTVGNGRIDDRRDHHQTQALRRRRGPESRLAKSRQGRSWVRRDIGGDSGRATDGLKLVRSAVWTRGIVGGRPGLVDEYHFDVSSRSASYDSYFPRGS
jgi:hypothetical protein